MSRKDDLINSYGGVSGIMAQTPDAKARIRNELLEAARQDAIDANNQAEKAAKGSLGQDLAGVAGSVAGTIGGAELGSRLFGNGSLFGSGSASTGTGAASGGAVGGTAGGAATGAVPAAPNVISATTTGGGASTGAGAGSSLLAGNGALATYGVPAAVAGATYLGGQAAYDMLQGKKPGLPGRAILGMATGGISELPGLLGIGIGHSKNYYQAKDRSNLAKNLNEKYGAGLDAKQWEDDPGSYTYDLNSPGKNKELGAAQALTAILTGAESGSKTWTDTSSRFANDIKNGMSVKDLYGKFGGLDYNKAMDAINSSKYDSKLKAELQNGLNDAFGAQPRQQSNNGSPGRRPNSSSSSRTPKQKAKAASDVLSKLWR